MKHSTTLRVALVLACVTSLSACNSYRASAEETVRETLKDPESARFGEFYYNDKTKRACLGVNAKNSMGGYTGEKSVMLERDGDRWVATHELEVDFDSCKGSYADSTELSGE